MCTFHFARPSWFSRLSQRCGRIPGRQLQLPLAHRPTDGRQQLAPEECHDHPRGEQTPVVHRHPVAGVGQASTGHEGVDMRMEAQRLGPRVQRGEDAGSGAQIGGIAQQLQQGVAHTGK
jgi:hypothetical protein